MNIPAQRVNGEPDRSGDASVPSARELLDRTRRVGDEVSSLAQAAQQAINGIAALARDRLERRPYATLAVAAGVGYVLGGGMPVALVRALLGVGSRIAVERAIAQLAAAK